MPLLSQEALEEGLNIAVLFSRTFWWMSDNQDLAPPTRKETSYFMNMFPKPQTGAKQEAPIPMDVKEQPKRGTFGDSLTTEEGTNKLPKTEPPNSGQTRVPTENPISSVHGSTSGLAVPSAEIRLLRCRAGQERKERDEAQERVRKGAATLLAEFFSGGTARRLAVGDGEALPTRMR